MSKITLTFWWGLLALAAVPLALIPIINYDPLALETVLHKVGYPGQHRIIVVFYAVGAFVVGISVFKLIAIASQKAWNDFSFSADDSNGRYAYKTIHGTEATADQLYQRFRFGSFWYITSSHIVLAAII